MRAIQLVALIMGLGLAVGAAQEARRPSPQEDARLNQKISLRYAATPLKELLAELSRRTGVALTAESRVREYRAFARLKEKPLHEVMRLLAQAFGFEWRVETDPAKPDAPPRYVLYQPAADRRAEQEWQKLYQTDMTALMRDIVRSIPPDLLQRDHAEFANALGIVPRYVWEPDVVLNEKEPEPPFQPLMEYFIPHETDLYRALLHHARRDILSEAGASHNAWLALQVMARFSEREWQALSTEGVLAIAVDAIPDELRQQWADAEEKMQAQKPSKDEMVTLREEDIREDTDSDAPASETDDEHLRALLDALEAQPSPPLTSVRFTYDPLLQTLSVDLCSMQIEANRTSYRQTPAFDLKLSDWLETAYRTFGRSLQDFAPPTDEDESPNLWALKTPFATIREAAWRRAKQDDWANWLSYCYIEACEGADIETVGEFYPFSKETLWHNPNEPVRTWSALMGRMIRAHCPEFEGKLVVWQAAARPLARLTDAPQSRLRPLLSQEQPTLDLLAVLCATLPQHAFLPLHDARTGFLSEFASTDAAIDAWAQALEQLASSSIYWTMRLYHSLTQPQRDALRRPRGLSWNDLSQSQKAIALNLLSGMDRGSWNCLNTTAYRTEAPTLQIQLLETRSAPMRRTASQPDEKGVWRTHVQRLQRREFLFNLRVSQQTVEIELNLPEPLPPSAEKRGRQAK